MKFIDKKIKKIAVVFSGQPRSIEVTHRYLKDFFNLESVGVKTDYHFHLWNSADHKSASKEPNSKNSPDIKLDHVKFSNSDLEVLIKDLYDPVYLRIDDQKTDPKMKELKAIAKHSFPNELDYTDQLRDVIKKGWFKEYTNNESFEKVKWVTAHIGQLESASRACEKILFFEKKFGEKYDICFRMRTDMVFKNIKTDPEIKLSNFVRMWNIIDDHRCRGLLNPVFVTYLKLMQGIPQTGDHYFVGDGQSISNFNKNAGYAVIKNYKKLIEICMKEGFEIPNQKDFQKKRDLIGDHSPHRGLHRPAETSWAECAYMNKTTLISSPFVQFLDYSLVRSNVPKNASIKEICSIWENWGKQMTSKMDKHRSE